MVVIIYILIAFLAGILFINLVYPLLDTLFSWITIAIEAQKQKLAVKMAKSQKEIEELTGKKEEEKLRVVGFQIPTTEEEEYEEEDE